MGLVLCEEPNRGCRVQKTKPSLYHWLIQFLPKTARMEAMR
jgi:hypothetical protein